MEFKNHGKEFAHWNILHSIAKQRRILHYLEVGVRYGDSLKVILEVQHPGKLTLCDTWGGESGGESFGGPTHIEDLLEELEYKRPVRFLNGSSHELLKKLPMESIDLILVDGDHTPAGAEQDLRECWTLLMPRGILVFDDLQHPSHPELLGIFRDFTSDHADVEVLLEDLKNPMGVGVLCKTL